MYERSYGYRYAELGDHPTAAEVARAVRGDVKQAIGEGLLPSKWSYSVTSETFSGGCSVDVEVRDCLDAWQDAATAHSVLTAEAESANRDPRVTCGAKCRGAIGPSCDCSCGGDNHGVNH